MLDKYDFYVGRIFGKNVISDGEHFAHCKTFKDGVIDLEFKKAKDRGLDQYSHLTLKSVVKFEEAKNMYRIITGACRQGTESFINQLENLKEEYSVKEIINLTNGSFGGSIFKKYFEK